MKRHLQDYCENTTIHGFKYVGEKGRSRIERIWWLIVLGLGMSGSAYLINNVWHKWHDSPVIVTFSDTMTPVWQIPFPTVTICSETKVRQSKFNLTRAFYSANMTDEERKKVNAISLLCDWDLNILGPMLTNESTIEVIKEVAPDFDEMIFLCTWQNVLVVCSEVFTQIMTEEGLCFSFNILNAMEIYRDTVVQSGSKNNTNKTKLAWSLDKGYDTSASLEAKPIRAIGAGALSGMSVFLFAYEYDLDYFCRGPVQGFKILVHNPAEIPRLNEHYFRVSHNEELILSVKPNMMTTSESLRSYQPSTRQCYFTSERQLAYFKVYTQRNCELECLTNYTLRKCWCVAIYMPRLKSTLLCGAGSKPCVDNAYAELKMEVVTLNIHKNQTLGNTCNCLPACVSLQYDAETSQGHFNWTKMFDVMNRNRTKLKRVQLTQVSVYFKDDQFFTSVRSELYGVADFFAICGGLLGLFSGISVLSLIEIVYYITLRFYFNVRSQKERPKNKL